MLSLEDQDQEIGVGDFRAGLGDQWLSLSSKEQTTEGRIKISVRLMSLQESPKNPESYSRPIKRSKDCARCSYLEKISESQQNELLSLEEHKSTYADIKQIIKEYYSADHIQYSTKYIPDIEELGIDVPQSYYGKSAQISKQEAEHLKEVLIGLTDKLKNLQIVQEDVKSLRQQLYDSHVNRLNLQTSIKENTEKLENKCKEQCKKHLEINEERAETMQSLLEQQHVYAQRCLDLDQLKSDLSTLNATLQQLKAEEFNFNTIKEHVNRLESELQESQTKKNDLKNEFNKTLQDFTVAKTNQTENIERLKKETNDLNLNIESLKTQILDQQNLNSGLEKVNFDIENEIKSLEIEIQDLVSENKSNELSRQTALEKEEACIKLHKDIHQAAKNFETELQTLSKVNSQLLSEKSSVVDDLIKLESTLDEKTIEIQTLTRNNYNSLVQAAILEQKLCIQNDRNEIRKNIEAQTEMNEKIKNILLSELAQMGEYLKKQSEECLSLSTTVQEYKNALDAKKFEKKELERIVDRLKQSHPVYVPIKGDQVDEILSEVLNLRSDWFDVSIKRLDQGSYSFGSKQVFIELDSETQEDNALTVKLGKGILAIKEFLDTYIPLELHKLQFSKLN